MNREGVMEAVAGYAESLLQYNPEITDMIREGRLTTPEIVLAFERRLQELTEVPVESGYHVSQATHSVRMFRMHAEVAQISAGS